MPDMSMEGICMEELISRSLSGCFEEAAVIVPDSFGETATGATAEAAAASGSDSLESTELSTSAGFNEVGNNCSDLFVSKMKKKKIES